MQYSWAEIKNLNRLVNRLIPCFLITQQTTYLHRNEKVQMLGDEKYLDWEKPDPFGCEVCCGTKWKQNMHTFKAWKQGIKHDFNVPHEMPGKFAGIMASWGATDCGTAAQQQMRDCSWCEGGSAILWAKEEGKPESERWRENEEEFA